MAGEKPRSFFDKLDAYAKEEGMGGIAYIAYAAGGAKGIDISPEGLLRNRHP